MSSDKKPGQIIVTKKADAFCRAVQKPGAPIVIFKRPEKYHALPKDKIVESFASWAWTQRRYHHPGLVHTTSDAISIHSAELPPTARLYLLELKDIFDRISNLGFAKSSIYVLQNSDGMMGRAGKKRVSPVLMAHWTAAGNGAMTPKQREILPEGSLGFFPANSDVPLHGYNNNSHSSVSVIVVPTFMPPKF
jgi:hypothetical protein